MNVSGMDVGWPLGWVIGEDVCRSEGPPSQGFLTLVWGLGLVCGLLGTGQWKP